LRFATPADIPRIEEICNDPQIRLWTAIDGAPACVADRYVAAPNFTILAEEGCFLLVSFGEGRYCVHTNLLPSYHGARALRVAREALEMAFLRTDMTELLTLVPACTPQAAWFSRSVGMRKRFERKQIYPLMGRRWDVDFFSLDIHDWIVGCERLRDLGEAFHARLHELRPDDVRHGEDPVHNAYVGAVAAMVEARVSPAKAVDLYNAWGRWAFYKPIRLASEDPMRIDIGPCVLRADEGSFTVEESEYA
jgi:hypothetical protein